MLHKLMCKCYGFCITYAKKVDSIISNEYLIPALTKAILTLSLIINVIDIDNNVNMNFCLHPTRTEKKSELVFEMIKTYETIA